jgi:hypothetical protein
MGIVNRPELCLLTEVRRINDAQYLDVGRVIVAGMFDSVGVTNTTTSTFINDINPDFYDARSGQCGTCSLAVTAVARTNSEPWLILYDVRPTDAGMSFNSSSEDVCFQRQSAKLACFDKD